MVNTQHLLDTIENLRSDIDLISHGLSGLVADERLPEDIRRTLLLTCAELDAALLPTVTLKEPT